jgi:hypothetical protein
MTSDRSVASVPAGSAVASAARRPAALVVWAEVWFGSARHVFRVEGSLSLPVRADTVEPTRLQDAEWRGAIHDEYRLSTAARRPRPS